MPSTVIRLISYDATSELLSVTFVSGRAYAYETVPAELFEDFLRAPSKGVFFNENIRGRYRFREIPRRHQRNRSAA